MIRLVVISDSPPTFTKYYDQTVVVIGSSASPLADLALAEESLHDKHIQIVQEKQQYYVVNLANDPFATLNGKPFGKKIVHQHDIIQVGNATIRLEIRTSKEIPCSQPLQPKQAFNDPKHASPLADTKELLPIILERKLNDCASVAYQAEEPRDFPHFDSFEAPLKEEILDELPFDLLDMALQQDVLDNCLQPEAIEDEDLNQPHTPLHRQKISHSSPLPIEIQPQHDQTSHPLADSLAAATVESLTSPSVQQLLPSPNESKPKLSLKDYYLSQYDDVSEPASTPSDSSSSNATPPSLSKSSWMTYLKIIGIFLIMMLTILGLIFLWMTDRSDHEEITASKAVADVAMALTYSQIKSIYPQNQNWSDPEFIKNNLISVLPSKSTSFADFDAHGQFSNCPYLLRIYTSADLSQFLVMAQPAPSLLQWLIPKSTIIVDSHAMEMRKTQDLKSLNRLLVSANTLEGTSALEVSNLVSQGTLIPLIHLTDEEENIGFSPPKALALIRPGAENLIYNAPRYFPLGEELIKKSLDLIEKPASSHEVTQLRQELATLNKFPNAVLYTSGGVQHAIHTLKALATFSPKEKFLIAYLQMNAKGEVTNSHLLIDDTLQEIARGEHIQTRPIEATGSHSPISITQEDGNAPESLLFGLQKPEELQNQEIDEDNPLFLQLSALNVFRQQALRPLNEEVFSLINRQTHAHQQNFESNIKQLIAKYIDIDTEQQAKILRKLDAIYRDNKHVPASLFFHFAKIAGLKESLIDYLAQLKQVQRVPEFTQENLNQHLKKIEKATDWQDFEQEVAELIEILNLERIPNEETIIAFQNITRSNIIQKLNQFILSPDHPHLPQTFDAEYRYTLIHILKMSWITDPDTYDFYLSEFDLRVLPRGSTQEDDEE